MSSYLKSNLAHLLHPLVGHIFLSCKDVRLVIGLHTEGSHVFFGASFSDSRKYADAFGQTNDLLVHFFSARFITSAARAIIKLKSCNAVLTRWVEYKPVLLPFLKRRGGQEEVFTLRWRTSSVMGEFNYYSLMGLKISENACTQNYFCYRNIHRIQAMSSHVASGCFISLHKLKNQSVQKSFFLCFWVVIFHQNVNYTMADFSLLMYVGLLQLVTSKWISWSLSNLPSNQQPKDKTKSPLNFCFVFQ